MRRKKFYFRLFTTYIITVFIYTLFVVLLFFNKNSEILNLEFNNVHQQFIEQIREKIDFSYMVGQNLAQQLVTNNHIVQYVNHPQKNQYYTTQILKDINRSTSSFSNLGFTIAVTKGIDDKVITAKHTIAFDAFCNEMGFDASAQENIINFIKEKNNTGQQVFLRSKSIYNETFFTVLRKEKIENKNNLIFLFPIRRICFYQILKKVRIKLLYYYITIDP